MRPFYSYIRFGLACSCLLLLALVSSCSKGYEVSFLNYSTEPVDSVVVGNNAVVFVEVPLETNTGYRKIGKGRHSVKIVTRSKRVVYGELNIAGTGSGRRTIQIDAIRQVSILED